MNKYKLIYNWRMPDDIEYIEADCYERITDFIGIKFYNISKKPRRFLWVKWEKTIYTLVVSVPFANGVVKIN